MVKWTYMYDFRMKRVIPFVKDIILQNSWKSCCPRKSEDV